LVIASNALLFLCVAGLALVGVNGGEALGVIPHREDANRCAVRDYLAQRVPDYRYRIRQWFPATPLTGDRATAEKEFAQRVTLVLYGPSGAKQLDTTYRIQNGRVTGAVAAN